MNISRTFIDRPVMTALLTLALTLAGVYAYRGLPVSDLPTVDSPVITINASYPGATPEIMANNVALPLENQCSRIQGLANMISTNSTGSTRIMLTFDLDRSVDLAAPDVQAAISNAQSDLPSDLPSPPTYSKENPSDEPMYYILVRSSSLTPGQLYDVANKSVKQQLSMIKGVSNVEIFGEQRAVRVQVDPQLLARYHIGINEVATALNTGTVNLTGGSVNGKYRAFLISPKGQLLKADEYNELIVKYNNNAPVKIKDIGRAIESTTNDVVSCHFLYKDGKGRRETVTGPVVLMVRRAAGTNTLELSKAIGQTLDAVRAELPASTQIFTLYDRAVTIRESIEDVKWALIEAFGLVVLVIFLFMGRLSDTIIPSVAMPMSILATFLLMKICGFSVDNLSLMALTVSVGFIVDDAIVVLENTVRLIEEGMSPFEAAIKSARDISGTVVSMTLSLIVVFFPLVFMSGVIGRVFKEFALVVIFVIACSGVISLTLTPMMCARMLKPHNAHRKTLVQRGSDWLMRVLVGSYAWALRLALRFRFSTVLIWIACLAGTWYFFSVVPKGFLPVGDSGLLMGGMLMPLGASTEQVRRYQKEVDNIILSDPNVAYGFTLTGMNAGADQSTGFCLASLLPRENRPGIDAVNDVLRQKFFVMNPYPLGLVFMRPYPVLQISAGGESTATGSRYSYSITGQDPKSVYKDTLKLERTIRTSMPEFLDLQNSVKLNMPQITVKLLRDRASTFGVTAKDIGDALANAFAQGKTTQYTTDIDQYWVILEVEKQSQRSLPDLSKIYVKSSTTGASVPLDSVAELQPEIGPQSITRLKQLTCGTLSFNLPPEVPLGTATKKLEAAARSVLSSGCRGVFEGQADEFQRSVASLGILILVAIFLKYVILGVLYESYVHPFTVLTSLPVGAVGGLGALVLLGAELSLYGYVGLFMLIGIVAKNGIMMVDFANHILETEKGLDAKEAIYRACLVRFRPILMTGVAAIMGAVPIAMGWGADGASRQPLGFVVVGGIAVSQVLTLFVTPGIYLYMEKFQEKFLDRFEITRSIAARARERKG